MRSKVLPYRSPVNLSPCHGWRAPADGHLGDGVGVRLEDQPGGKPITFSGDGADMAAGSRPHQP